jgi:hypothetical protein
MKGRFALIGVAGMLSLGASLLASATAPAAIATARGSTCTAEVVRPERGERRTRFLAWLAVHWKEAGWTEGEELGYVLDRDAGFDRLELLIADIDNDGAEEYVLTAHEGSGGYLWFWVFRRAGEGWAMVAETPFADGGGHDYRDPISDESQFLVRFCGRTHINFEGGSDPNHSRDTREWSKGRAHRVCNRAWLEEQRRGFQALFDRGLYDEAHGFLDGLERACRSAVGRETWFWIESDLARAASGMQAYDDCLAHVAVAQRHLAFARASAAVRETLSASAATCAAGKAKPPQSAAAAYDFSWLRDPKWANEQPVLDPRFNGLLSATVPDRKLEDGRALRDALKMSIWAPDDDTKVIAGRYVILAGFEPQAAGNMGFIWIDTVAKRSIFGTERMFGSKTVDSAHIPPEFWRQLKGLGNAGYQTEQDGAVLYVEPNGRTTKLTGVYQRLFPR